MNTQMKKGILEMCVLFLVSEQELYGYEILKKMNIHFPAISESAFYVILRRINRLGFTDSYIKNNDMGPKRKYYFITEAGEKELNEYINDWINLTNIVSEIGIR